MKKNDKINKDISSCMGRKHMVESYEDPKQRAAVCYKEDRGNSLNDKINKCRVKLGM